MATHKISHSFQKDFFEIQAWSQSKVIAGIDEVGRGCVMGPVVVACVILPQQTPLFIRDSKTMSPQARKTAYAWIIKHCYSTYAISNPRLIDQYNIYQATLLAMRKVALQALMHHTQQISTFLVDAMPLDMSNLGHENLTIYHFNKAESLSSSVAAASIVAKVVRDQIMRRLALSFVDYGIEHHKGYPTHYHQQQLMHKKNNALYRTTFLKSWP